MSKYCSFFRFPNDGISTLQEYGYKSNFLCILFWKGEIVDYILLMYSILEIFEFFT